MTLSLLLLIVAFICFVVAAVGVPTNRINMVATGLAFWVLANIISGGLLQLS